MKIEYLMQPGQRVDPNQPLYVDPFGARPVMQAGQPIIAGKALELAVTPLKQIAGSR